MIPVIICGGFGTKLWPLSREHKPKHFLSLFGGKSLFQLNYEALRTKFKPEEIYVSTNVDQMELAKKQEPEIPESNFILEPEMRNTGPASGLIAATLYKKGYPDEPFVIIQADDLRLPTEEFIRMIDSCGELAKKDNKYITGGFRPEFPTMGVDHLIRGERVSGENDVAIYKVDKFVWRGSKEQNEELIKQENALVHANHTCMTPRNFLEMYKKYREDWYTPSYNIAKGEDLQTEFAKMPAGPLEELTEKVFNTGEALIVELPFKWYDFGTFESLSKYLIENGMYKPGENIIDLNGKDNFVKLDDPNKIVGLVGVDNLIVIDTGDVLLISAKDSTGQVGEVRKEVEKRKLETT